MRNRADDHDPSTVLASCILALAGCTQQPPQQPAPKAEAAPPVYTEQDRAAAMQAIEFEQRKLDELEASRSETASLLAVDYADGLPELQEATRELHETVRMRLKQMDEQILAQTVRLAEAKARLATIEQALK